MHTHAYIPMALASYAMYVPEGSAWKLQGGANSRHGPSGCHHGDSSRSARAQKTVPQISRRAQNGSSMDVQDGLGDAGAAVDPGNEERDTEWPALHAWTWINHAAPHTCWARHARKWALLGVQKGISNRPHT